MNKNNIDKLYVIGNGFDLHHRMKTRYIDFHNYLETKDTSLLYLLNNYFHGDLWNEFENCLANLDMGQVLIDNTELLPDPNSDRDGEKYMLPDKMREILHALTSGLRDSINSWILQVKYPKDINNYLLSLDINVKYLSFNYSNTLEDIYKIPASQIIHIHNRAVEKHQFNCNYDCENTQNEDMPIIGHSRKNTNKKVDSNVIKEIGMVYEAAIENLKPYYDLSYKKTEELISYNSSFFSSLFSINQIIVLGHSLAEVDMAYFKKIASNVHQNANWTISYYDRKEISHLKRQAKQFVKGSQNCSFKSINSL